MKILVSGDTMKDVYYYGDLTRIAPEAPVPVFRVDKVEAREGAASNVALNIESLGIPCERIFGGGERINKVRLLANGQHVARVDFDYPQIPILPDAAFQEAVGRCEIVVFLDYGKGSLTHINALIGVARSMGKQVLVDPKGHDYGKYRGAHLIKPNRDEMKELVGGWSNQKELDFKARQFLLGTGIESILLTQAEEGLTLYTMEETHHFPSEAKNVVSVSGAGEAVISAYAAALAKGMEKKECARLANKAAGVCVGLFGTVILEAKDVFEEEKTSPENTPS